MIGLAAPCYPGFEVGEKEHNSYINIQQLASNQDFSFFGANGNNFKILRKIEKIKMRHSHGGGGGFHSKGTWGCDVPPARVCFFKPSSLAKGILFANFRPFSLGKGIFLAILVKELSNFGNSCKETQIFFKFWSLECKNLASFASKMPTHGTFDVGISLAKVSFSEKSV